MPSFIQSIPIIDGYMNIYRTHSLEDALKLRFLDDTVFQEMIRIVRQLKIETEEDKNGSKDMVYALLLELTVSLNRILNFEKQEMSGTYKAMSEIKNYIDFHYMEDLSLNELSRRFFLQPNTISKNFSKVFGKNINSYINSARVTNAVRILEETEISITELSELVGYTSVNTFLRHFREKMNDSPLQYKKRFKQYIENTDTFHLP